MQTSRESNRDQATGVPLPDAGERTERSSEPMERDEDSGLHDIRSMASSTKMRLSSRRITQPPVVDDDILASSSAGWKAVALPEPARMVSLPEIAAEAEVTERPAERKSKKELKAERASAKKIATEAVAVETSAPTPVAQAASVAAAQVSAPATESAPLAFNPARFSKPAGKSKAGLYSAIGLGLAAAAGVGWYVSTQMTSSSKNASEQVAMNAPAAEPTPVAATPTASQPAPPPAPAAVEEKPADTVATGMGDGKADEAGAAIAADDEPTRRAGKGAPKAKKDENKVVIDLDSGPKRAEPKDKDKAKEPEVKAEPKSGEGEPSFDQLLKEAGVQEKKPEKPKLDKKSLSGADIKAGMGSVASKAQACFNGTQGTAIVKLTVAPSGQVEKVKVTGVFAGTPVGACVEAAVRGAKFPAWDGGPQSFGYSYLLAE